jgi:ATP-dependent exoDNAse (exonuclease V) beta subunit
VEGCPKFGAATVLDRPMEYGREEEFSVRPGWVRPEHGGHRVAWWDPSALQLGVRSEFGTQHEMLIKDNGGLAAYCAWEAERERVLTEASHPEHDAFLASQATEEPPHKIAVSFESTKTPRAARPSGRRFGTLVHGVMSDVKMDADESAIGKLVALHGKIVGATKEELDAAASAALAALSHPLLQRARKAQRCHREYPIVLPLDGVKLLEGIVDLAFVENDAWVVVDFKTDADVSARLGHYERQLQWYAYALTKLTGMPATAWILGI